MCYILAALYIVCLGAELSHCVETVGCIVAQAAPAPEQVRHLDAHNEGVADTGNFLHRAMDAIGSKALDYTILPFPFKAEVAKQDIPSLIAITDFANAALRKNQWLEISLGSFRGQAQSA